MKNNIIINANLVEENERPELITDLSRNISKLKNELVFSKYSLNPLAQDIIQLMIAQIKHESLQNPEFHIKIKIVEDKLGRRVKEEEIISACDNILNQKLYLNTNKVYIGYNWCEYVYYEKEDRSLKIKFTPKISSLLLNLVDQGGFTKMNLKYFLKIKSFYAKRIYMLLKGKLDFEVEKFNKEESIKIMSISELKDTLNIDQNSYKEINDLRKRVVDISVNQINKFSDMDLKIEFLTDKTSGKKFTKIKFISSLKKDLEDNKSKESKKEKKNNLNNSKKQLIETIDKSEYDLLMSKLNELKNK